MDSSLKLQRFNVPLVWKYLQESWRPDQHRPDEGTTVFCPLTKKQERVIYGKWILIEQILSRIQLWIFDKRKEMLVALVSPQPQMWNLYAIDHLSWPKNKDECFPELRKALAPYLKFSYTLDGAPTRTNEPAGPTAIPRWGFDRALSKPTTYPNGAPMSGGPQNVAVTILLQQFITIGLAIVDLWIIYPTPTLYQY
ncbi:hypothetical protein BCR34DRAFT_593801 [Clohesyomyces aquaticus]|uniref:Uncharacterized protein n=1 Tax=Clohesyomyces aquaticus TaxID=1231657 RepID=A0A1Y1YFV1_9PLEO|nr:hypothetical protein BCR34DRAFT_593801 [Clohesyomyces aquaticus]